ncbi:MAG: hypothetical protein AAF208_10850 [Cyanobacteria bacterium P01_A01_bin.45]|mgnify:CR=1 FL=1
MQSLYTQLLFGVIWYEKIDGILYESWKKSLVALIGESKKNQKLLQELHLTLHKSFLEAQKSIAKKCQNELCKESVVTRYRGSITYSPPENDRDIKILENKIKIINKQLKEINKKFRKQEVLSLEKIENLLVLYNDKHQSSELAKEYRNQILRQAEEDCDIEIYKVTLLNKIDNLYQTIYNFFLQSIGNSSRLNRIFNIYLLAEKNKVYENSEVPKDIKISQSLKSSVKHQFIYKTSFTPINDTSESEYMSDLDFALEKSFLEAQKLIAEQCKEQLIKVSTIATLYRGIPTYSPPGNNIDIQNLESKIESLNMQLQKLHNMKFKNEINITFDRLEDLLELYRSNNYLGYQGEENIEKVFQEAEKGCDVNKYKIMLRDDSYGLFSEVYKKLSKKQLNIR